MIQSNVAIGILKREDSVVNIFVTGSKISCFWSCYLRETCILMSLLQFIHLALLPQYKYFTVYTFTFSSNFYQSLTLPRTVKDVILVWEGFLLLLFNVFVFQCLNLYWLNAILFSALLSLVGFRSPHLRWGNDSFSNTTLYAVLLCELFHCLTGGGLGGQVPHNEAGVQKLRQNICYISVWGVLENKWVWKC